MTAVGVAVELLCQLPHILPLPPIPQPGFDRRKVRCCGEAARSIDLGKGGGYRGDVPTMPVEKIKLLTNDSTMSRSTAIRRARRTEATLAPPRILRTALS